MNLMSKFRKSLKHKYHMRFHVRFPTELNCDGVVTHITEEFVVLHETYELEFNGIAVIPITAIKGCRDEASERTFNEVLRHSGQISKLRVPSWVVKCNSVQDIFEQLMKRDIWPNVELAQKRNTWFMIGPVTKVEESGFSIRHYSATGRWYVPTTIGYEDLRTIGFGGSYARHFNAYMRAKTQ